MTGGAGEVVSADTASTLPTPEPESSSGFRKFGGSHLPRLVEAAEIGEAKRASSSGVSRRPSERQPVCVWESSVVACPVCSSVEYEAIAPTLLECRGLRERSVYTGPRQVGWQVPGVVPILEPGYGSEVSVCGVRRMEVAVEYAELNWPLCRCGTYSVGRCVACSSDICGDDSRKVHGARMCLSCADATVWSVEDVRTLTG